METFKTKIDIKAGDLTFGQRIGLGKIYDGPESDFEKFEKVFILLEGRKPEKEDLTNWVEYLSNFLIGLVFWAQQESTLLKYEPTKEEQKALNTNVDYISTDPAGNTVRALARNYNVEPADVLNWEFSKVFKILFDDLEKSKRERSNANCN